MVKRSSTSNLSLHSAAVKMGSAGGQKGGPARANALTHPQKEAIAKQGAAARWKKT